MGRVKGCESCNSQDWKHAADSQYTIGEIHKSLTGKTRLNDKDLEVFVCDSDCDHTMYFLDKPDCIGEFYSAKYLVALIKGEK